MTTKEITVADIIKFFQSIPPETKIRVKEEVTRNWETYTKYTNVIQYGNGEFDIECVDGISYSKEKNVVDFGI
jgi:hypothetical protein